jgi:DNA repair ATPase RecN
LSNGGDGVSVTFDFNFWTVLLFLLNFALALFVAVSNRSKAAQDELKSMKSGLESRLDEIKDAQRNSMERISRIEARAENGVKMHDIEAVYKSVNEISAQSNHMAGQLTQICEQLKDIRGQLMTRRNNDL